MLPTRIHHLSFVVHDLAEATARFENILGLDPFEIVDHQPRGARVAHTRIGDSWLVLVSPYDSESAPGQYLAQHGEGLFLVSLGFEDLVQQLERLEASGVELVDQSPRDGILDWRVADIGILHGTNMQFTKDIAAADE
ncbi:MAG: methylmalonyl-CoA epimerase [Woeseiaceae bacterium]|nr:methylmalonyl-CoA epimerase [Woeseiaceae bacterium]NIP22142.1 methylmalonyl-CoA epimerase [Woeseiaceae bacterium]NIS91309.1 methylmalonyl-CoA epimerase [Woeseiaceae bacterium]